MKKSAIVKRLIVGLGLPALLLLLLLYEHLDGESLQCPFYRLTNLYCPGCGSGRAVRALLQGELAQSFRWNPMLYLLGVPCALVILYEYLRIVFFPEKLRAVVLPRWACILLAAVILAWWILRNLPGLSFLAPCA